MIGDAIKTVIGNIYSLSICESSNKVLLSVNGQYPSYSDKASDILDITELVKEYGKKMKFTKKTLPNWSNNEKIQSTRNVLMKSSSYQRTHLKDILDN